MNRYLEKVAASNEHLVGVEPMMPHVNKAMTYDSATGGKVGALTGSALGAAAGISAGAPLSALAGAALGGLGGWVAGSLAGGAVGIPHGIVNSMIAERQLRQDIAAKAEANRYLQKVANNLTEVPISGWNPDSYARKLGWEDPRKAALHAGAMSLAMAPPRSGDGSMGHNVSTAAMTALNASSAHTEAEEFNQRLREILEAQEHGVRTGDMSLHHELKEDLMDDPHASMWGGRVAGGLLGAVAGGATANMLGANPLGIGAGALVGGGLAGWGLGAMAEAGAENHNENTEHILRAREAYLRAKLVKSAEESIPHDYKPGLAAGAIDAGMGVGLGSLGAYISKKHLNGKYAPLLIGGMEGAAAMTATDIFQRKHEKEMHDALKTH